MTSSEPPATTPAPAVPIAVVVAHGELAAGLVSAVEQITGRGALFVALSNRDLGIAELEAQVLAWVDRGVRVLFTDLPAGSTTVCARRLQRTHPGLIVFTGSNLAALLAFALAADKGIEEAARDAAEKARAALQVSGGAATSATGG